jgi:hypothetical protein
MSKLLDRHEKRVRTAQDDKEDDAGEVEEIPGDVNEVIGEAGDVYEQDTLAVVSTASQRVTFCGFPDSITRRHIWLLSDG